MAFMLGGKKKYVKLQTFIGDTSITRRLGLLL